MNEEYLRGFLQKCAEAGVDPEEIVKLSAGPVITSVKELADPGFLQRLLNLLKFKQFRHGMKWLGKTTTPNMAAMSEVWNDPKLMEQLMGVSGRAWRDIGAGGAKSLGLYGGLGAAGIGAASLANSGPNRYLDMYRS
jgi:hypothetical protein